MSSPRAAPPLRLSAAVVAAVALLAGATPPASAKVTFEDMRGRVLHWDQRVSSTILGCPGNDSCRKAVEGVVVYLRRGPASRATTSRRGRHRLGAISPRGTIAFRVPHVSPGRYHLVARLPAGSDPRWARVSATFKIRRR